jgi:hypothetical protein
MATLCEGNWGINAPNMLRMHLATKLSCAVQARPGKFGILSGGGIGQCAAIQWLPECGKYAHYLGIEVRSRTTHNFR